MKTIKKPDGTEVEVEDNYTLEEGEEFVEKEPEEKPEEKPEENDEDDEEEKKLDNVLNKKVDKIVQAIKDNPVRKKIIGADVTKEKSVMETDPVLRKHRPFIQLSETMETFIGFVRAAKSIAQGVIPQSLQKALQESSDPAGGFLVPEEFSAEVIRYATEAAVVRPRARVFPMGSNTLTLPKLEQSVAGMFGGVDIAWEGDEGDLKEESQPVFGRITLKLNKMIGLCPVSDDLLADSAINLANFLVSLFGEAIAYEEDSQFLIGNGVKKPLGIVNCGTAVNRGTATRIKYQDLKNMMTALPAWADAGAVWITTKAGLEEILDIRSEDTQGFPLFLPGFHISQGIPKSLFGHELLLTDKLSNLGVKGDIVLANLSAYFIGDRGGLQVASSIHSKFEYDETVFRFVKRVDGQCGLSTAFVVLDVTSGD